MNIFNYNEKILEYIPCNLCGSSDHKIIVRKSVNDLKVNTVMCKKCSLIFINPRMTSGDYDEYYKIHYRYDRAEIKKKKYSSNLNINFENARKFGKAIVLHMGKYIKDGLTVDVGSSTGGILYGMKELRPNLDLLGIEPSLEESLYAQSKGVNTIRGLFEDININSNYKIKNILCVQSLNHLLDPMKFLLWSNNVLDNGDHIFLAVKNWKHQVYRMGRLDSGVQIDHVYMFTPDTLSLMCRKAGFDIVYMDVDEGKTIEEISQQKKEGLNTHHIRLVAKKRDISGDIKISKLIYFKMRVLLFPLVVKCVYIYKYSHRFAFLRKILHIS